MQAGQYDITIQQGATFALLLTYKDDNGNPIDLTGFTARMKIKITNPSTSEIIELTTENGRIVLGGISGTINLLLDANTTGGLDFTNAVYDLELVNGSNVQRLIQGSVTLSKQVTV